MWAIGEARRASADPARPPRVVLANRAQIRQWRQRVAAQGGALGLQLLTFDDLHVEILQAAGEHPVRLPDPVQVRLMRALLDATPLVYFAALRLSPSLPGMLRDLWTELSAAGIDPDSFTAYCARQPERMQDLAQLYAAYRMRMEDENWVDRATLGTLAVRALQAHTTIGSDWPLLLLDGIDDLTTVELQVLALLAARVERISVFLTGDAEGRNAPAATAGHLLQGTVWRELLPFVRRRCPTWKATGAVPWPCGIWSARYTGGSGIRARRAMRSA